MYYKELNIYNKYEALINVCYRVRQFIQVKIKFSIISLL
jgi:hypothetical protein